MNKVSSQKTICPFYVYDTTQAIHCHGIVSGTIGHSVFSACIDKEMHQDMYCYGFQYKKCPLAKAIMKRISETEKNIF